MVHIPIHIPIGTKYIATARASALKVLSCENCKQPYAFPLEVVATGEDLDLLFLDGEESKKRANAQAQENLASKLSKTLVAIPCPNCGAYQTDMAQQLKEAAWMNGTQVAGAVVILLSMVPFAFEIEYTWIVSIAIAAAGASLLAYGYRISYCYDPNAGDPGPRKEIGQKNAIWGERLAQVLADGNCRTV